MFKALSELRFLIRYVEDELKHFDEGVDEREKETKSHKLCKLFMRTIVAYKWILIATIFLLIVYLCIA